MTQAKDKIYIVDVDDLTIGGICKGLKKGKVIKPNILTALKKNIVKIDNRNISIFDNLLLKKVIMEKKVEEVEEVKKTGNSKSK